MYTNSISRMTVCWTLLTALLILFVTANLGGCAGPQIIRHTYVAHSESFATASNQQLLLYLARLRNSHPPHFFQMGAVTAQFSFNGGLNGGYADTEGVTTQNMGLSFGASESPVPNFTPLIGTAYGNILLTPFNPKVLHSITKQNISVALTVRLLVDRITLVYENGVEATFRNQFNRENGENFGDTLRLVKILERLQGNNLLGIENSESGELRFVLNGRGYSALHRYIQAEPRYEFVSFDRDKGQGAVRIQITTRSFMNILFSAAWESRIFDQFPDTFVNSLPEGVRDPVLRIDNDAVYSKPVAAEVVYARKRYVISDKPGSNLNRTSFALLQLLASRTQLDPSQLPTQQLI